MRSLNINEPGSDVPSTLERDALRRKIIEEESAWRKMRFIPVDEKKLIGGYEGFSLIARSFTEGGGFPEEKCLIWNNSNENDTLALDEKELDDRIESFFREERFNKRFIIAGILALAGLTALVVKLQLEYQQPLKNQSAPHIKKQLPDEVSDESISKEGLDSDIFTPKKSE